jgi:hypothetical protein
MNRQIFFQIVALALILLVPAVQATDTSYRTNPQHTGIYDAPATQPNNVLKWSYDERAGSITGTSEPAGAAIKLDGSDTGEITPYTFDNQNAGAHTLEISLAGYELASKTVTVAAGTTLTADFPLVPVSDIPAPEFPTLALPVGMVLGLIGVIYHIRTRKE